MMAFMMPAFSGYMTWNYASGLALYWSVGNLISIATAGRHEPDLHRQGDARDRRQARPPQGRNCTNYPR